ncbi:MAG TPA: transketolase C-terminal domain-containing protein [Candidatus Dormibacteraeota bacterium]
MRKQFVATLTELAVTDERVVLLTADLGFMVLEPFAQRHPDRFFNVGVAEANMISLAAGMASEGFIPFCYSIATFASMRGYEQFRNGAVLHELPVRIVGIGGGFAYGSAGFTHHALEDVALMRVQPGVGIVAPADDAQVDRALRDHYARPQPMYLRLAKETESHPELEGHFRWGHLETIGDGDIVIVALGSMTGVALEAHRRLLADGVHTVVAVAASIAPAPTEDLVRLLASKRACITIEDHRPIGGLGSLVAEAIADHGLGVRLIRRGVIDRIGETSGSEEFLRRRNGLDVEGLIAAVREVGLVPA